MAFADYKPFYLKITDQDGNAVGQVRALNDADLTLLWQKHEETMESVFQTLGAGAGAQPGQPVNWAEAAPAVALTVARTAPDLVSDIIALASGEEWDAAFQGASQMPLGLRVSILSAVIQLSLGSEGGLEKLFDLVNWIRTAPSR